MRVCFVCTGNICRSPVADVVLRRLAADTPLTDGTTLADHLEVDSAGTGNWHAGEPMDPRAAAVLAAHGYVDHGHRARAFEAGWFDRYDLVVAVARSHQQTLRGLARNRVGGGDDHDTKLVLLRSYDRRAGGEVDVPDPYYGEYADFEACLAMVETACRGLVEVLAATVDGRPAVQAPDGSSVISDPAS
ncbi:MAG: low molecular weight protein-tyrosine-phosphatase [Acidimicrobiales bacterium]